MAEPFAQPSYNARSRYQQPHLKSLESENEVIWTATRCNRLLRPLSSRLLLLRKSCAKAGPKDMTADFDDSYLYPRNVAFQNKYRLSKHTKATYNEDPEWIPIQKSKRKIRQQYTGRRTRLQSEGEAKDCKSPRSTLPPGEVIVPTPAIARNLSIIQEPAQKDVSPKISNPRDTNLATPTRTRLQGKGNTIFSNGAPIKQLIHGSNDTLEPQKRSLVNGIYAALDCLLRSTMGCRGAQIEGAPTLLLMCLRKVPDYVIEEEIWLRESDNLAEQPNLSSEVYSELEVLGASNSGGWTPLRHVVRAHGISMIKRAILEGTLNDEAVRGLVLICTRNRAFSEAEVLLSTMLSVCRIFEKPTTPQNRLFDLKRSASLHTLELFVKASGRRGYLYRQLDALFRGGQIPLQWLATEDLLSLWSQILQTFPNSNNGHKEGKDLIFNALRHLCHLDKDFLGPQTHQLRLRSLDARRKKRMREQPFSFLRNSSQSIKSPLKSRISLDRDQEGSHFPLENTFSSIAVILTAKSMLHGNNSHGDSDMHLFHCIFLPLQSLALDIERTTELGVLNPPFRLSHQLHNRRALQVVLANYFASACFDQNLRDMPSVVTERNLQALHSLLRGIRGSINACDGFESISKFICSIARRCGRVYRGDGFCHLKSLVRLLVSIAESSSSIHTFRQEKRLLAGIGLDSAMHFSEQTGSSEHLQYAQEIEKFIIDSDLVWSETQNRGGTSAESSRTKFRWEEGICEWIAETPTAAIRHRACSRASTPCTAKLKTTTSDIQNPGGDAKKHNKYSIKDRGPQILIVESGLGRHGREEGNSLVQYPVNFPNRYISERGNSDIMQRVPSILDGQVKRRLYEASLPSRDFRCKRRRLNSWSRADNVNMVSELYSNSSNLHKDRPICEHSDEDELATGESEVRIRPTISSGALKEIGNVQCYSPSTSSAPRSRYWAQRQMRKVMRQLNTGINGDGANSAESEDELCQSA
ncbi:hypothetical protein L228DRAFT_239220 [Xylona heveae TC161]|uniref:Uncharacterized protein n=1 Tax=Xylona heveae (strain CBS 132557 / TC161) TaxID=1328760 RepID=A0A165GIJ1_XYLHT|nr:hypothetical protein L228DRAFT_239220 [Xylona heveae TC161]KZF22226.1 hypothetical protein L228DRAFT_239220 [Xylona heveae TC161]